MEKLRVAVEQTTLRAARWQPAARVRVALGLERAGGGDQHGQGLAEYALILGLIAIVAITSLIFMGTGLSNMFMDPISRDFGAVLSRLGI